MTGPHPGRGVGRGIRRLHSASTLRPARPDGQGELSLPQRIYAAGEASKPDSILAQKEIRNGQN